MTARCEIVDENVTPLYHVMSRCVRALFLLEGDEEDNHRKQWVKNRLVLLTSAFSIHVMNYTCMDNHFHLVVRLDTPRMRSWGALEVVERWTKMFIPRDRHGNKIAEERVEEWIEAQAKDREFVAKARKTLSDLGCFMKALKQPLSRMCNMEDGKKGAFFETRYKSIGIIGEEALVSTNVYIDLNAVKAGVVDNPEDAEFSGFHDRMEHLKAKGLAEELAVAGMEATDYETAVRVHQAGEILNKAEITFWMSPVNDARGTDPNLRPGMSPRLNPGTLATIVHAVAIKIRTFRATDAITPELRAMANRMPPDPARDTEAIADAVMHLKSQAVNDQWGFWRGSQEDHAATAKTSGRPRIFPNKAKPPAPPVRI